MTYLWMPGPKFEYMSKRIFESSKVEKQNNQSLFTQDEPSYVIKWHYDVLSWAKPNKKKHLNLNVS